MIASAIEAISYCVDQSVAAGLPPNIDLHRFIKRNAIFAPVVKLGRARRGMSEWTMALKWSVPDKVSARRLAAAELLWRSHSPDQRRACRAVRPRGRPSSDRLGRPRKSSRACSARKHLP